MSRLHHATRLFASRVAPDDLSYPNDNGDCSVDGPLVVVHHKTHRTAGDHRGVEGEVKRLQNPDNAQAEDDQAQT